MEELKKSICLRCAFCHSKLFALPYKNYAPFHGSLIVCANCGRENDVTSLIFVVKAKAMDIAEDYADKLIDKFQKDLKKAFKGSKHIKFK
ncbi:hypothetical protein VO451_001361 [Enterobacter hormaechei]|nr:hypothetical protein [Enterobacter hormaechei]